MKFTERHRTIFIICAAGLIIRLVYAFFFARYISNDYFDIYAIFQNRGDFSDWLTSIRNFVETGSYTVDPTSDYGYFSRMPGYAIFIGFFYYLFSDPYYLYAIGCTQILLDSVAIFFIYRIYNHLFPHSRYFYIAPILYAFHPLIVFWSPVLLSESLSLFFIIWAVYIYACTTYRNKFLYVGLIIGFGILIRPQLGVFALVFLILQSLQLLTHLDKKKLVPLLSFTLGICLTYGLWPIRNYLFYKKIILTHDIRGIAAWGPDVSAYLEYTGSVQTNWEPQMSQILSNKPFVIDKKIAYATPTDSADLAKAIYLAKHYGSGFSHWKGYWKAPVAANFNDTLIVSLFKKLHRHQVIFHPFHYWIVLPLESLKKCLFKIELSKPHHTLFSYLTTLVFLFRTSVLLAGIAGAVIYLRKSYHFIMALIFVFFISWYLILCIGPPMYMRNIEMRYLLQADTLMLIPASYFFSFILEKLNFVSR